MNSEIFHTIRACNRQFTGDEWSDYCKLTRNDDSKRIFNTFGRYTFNDCDICINPDIDTISVKEGAWAYNVRIKYAECGNGLYAYGIDYCTGTGGGGFGVSWADSAEPDSYHRGYHSERECKIAAAEAAIIRLGDSKGCKKLAQLIANVTEYKRALERPQVVQLELF